MKGPEFEVFSLFPEAVEGFVQAGLLGKAIESGLVTVHTTNFRDYATDKHRTVDDTPFGGGPGMVMKIDPVVSALEDVEEKRGAMHKVLLTPSAPAFTQDDARALLRHPRIALLCGRYEGIDDRVREHYVDACFSIGDYVLNGGEVAALVIIEAVSRLCDGVIGNPDSAALESHAEDDAGKTLEHPHYTRPQSFRGHDVPAVLTSGDHAAVQAWREAKALERTWVLRPDLRRCSPLAREVPLYLALPTHADIAPNQTWVDAVRHHDIRGLFGFGEGADAFSLRWAAGLGGRASVTTFRDLRTARRVLSKHHGGEAAVLTQRAGAPQLPPLALLDQVRSSRGEPAVVILVAQDPQASDGTLYDAQFAPSGSFPEGALALPQMLIESAQPWSQRALPTLDRALAFLRGMYLP